MYTNVYFLDTLHHFIFQIKIFSQIHPIILILTYPIPIQPLAFFFSGKVTTACPLLSTWCLPSSPLSFITTHHRLLPLSPNSSPSPLVSASVAPFSLHSMLRWLQHVPSTDKPHTATCPLPLRCNLPSEPWAMISEDHCWSLWIATNLVPLLIDIFVLLLRRLL